MTGGLMNLLHMEMRIYYLMEIQKKHFLKQLIKNIQILVYNVLELIMKELKILNQKTNTILEFKIKDMLNY